jgi:hypothetical protein
VASAADADCAICCSRQARHQQAAAAAAWAAAWAASGAGTGTTGGKALHQQGPLPPSAIAQEKAAPHRVQILM